MSEINMMNIQVVLFFQNEIEFNSLKIANDICEVFPEIGQPNIYSLPPNVPNEVRLQANRIVFNNNQNVNISMTIQNIAIVIKKESVFPSFLERFGKLVNSLNDGGLIIKSIGIVTEYKCSDVDDNVIKDTFYKDELADSDLVNASWYNKEQDLNVWKFMNIVSENDKRVLQIKCDVNNRTTNRLLSTEEFKEIILKANKISKEFRDKISHLLDK